MNWKERLSKIFGAESLYPECDRGIMGKYKKWREIEKEDEKTLEKYTSLGWVEFDIMFSAARLTEMGRSALGNVPEGSRR